MGTERQIVKVETQGVPQAEADLRRLDADLKRTETQAKQTEAAAKSAAGAAQGTSLLERFRAGTLLTKGGLKLGPLKFGKGGIGIDNLNTFALAGRAVLPVAAVHALNGVMTNASDLWDEADDKGFWNALGDNLADSAKGIGGRVLGLGKPGAKLLLRAFGVRGDVFEEAYNQLTEPLQSEEERRARTAERRAKEREERLRIEREEEAERKRAEALQQATQKADDHFQSAMAGLETKRPVGFMFRRRSEFEAYRKALIEKNRGYEEIVREEMKRQAAKKIAGAGG